MGQHDPYPDTRMIVHAWVKDGEVVEASDMGSTTFRDIYTKGPSEARFVIVRVYEGEPQHLSADYLTIDLWTVTLKAEEPFIAIGDYKRFSDADAAVMYGVMNMGLLVVGAPGVPTPTVLSYMHGYMVREIRRRGSNMQIYATADHLREIATKEG